MGLWAFGVVVILAACSNNGVNNADDTLPTLAQLPVVTGALPTSAQAAQAATQGRVTLPPTWTASPPPTMTNTPTVTPSATITDTITFTPSATITDTPTITPTFAPTIPLEQRALGGLLMQAAQFTPLPTQFQVPGYTGINPGVTQPAGLPTPIIVPTQPIIGGASCDYLPPGGFGLVYNNNPDIAQQLGCPSGSPPDVLSIPAALQRFQNGLMVWLDGTIYVLYAGGSFQRYDDTFVEGQDPERSRENAPEGLYVPVRGFLKVWSNFSNVRSGLGYAIEPETGTQATVLRFSNGRMVDLPLRNDVLVFVSQAGAVNGTWRSVVGGF